MSSMRGHLRAAGNAGSASGSAAQGAHRPAPGKVPRVQRRNSRRNGGKAVQAKAVQADGGPPRGSSQPVQDIASDGLRGGGGSLPGLGSIQRSFGRHDVSGVVAHRGSEAVQANKALGSRAFTSGNSVALTPGADLHTVAHEAAHVVQQRHGASPPGGVGSPGDQWERHADAVADRVVRGQSAEGLLDGMSGGGSSGSSGGVVQHKLEFAQHYDVAPQASMAAVKADYSNYAAYQKQFERKLGVGLFSNNLAHEGADVMLARMAHAMEAAGFSDQERKKAFAARIKENSKSVDLGGLLLRDVEEALNGGNLREKMGMVYQARFEISRAIAKLAKEDNRELIGDEMFSDEMQQDMQDKEDENKPVSYAVLKRRQSVQDFKRTGAKNKKGLITPKSLESQGIGLSEREERARKQVGAKKFYAGREFYKVDKGARKTEQDKLRRVVAGLSGSTDMYFHIANHLKMDVGARRKFRLAALGQMLTNQDHSYHEIMHVAKTQGGLTDYADELPMGYTTLAPLAPNDILNVAGLEDFPGDAQIRHIGVIDKSSDVRLKSAPGKRSHSYPAVLGKIDEYHATPSPERLQAVITAIDKFVKDKKPGKHAWDSTKRKYNERSTALLKVRGQCEQLKRQWEELSKVPREELAKLARKSMDGDSNEDLARMTRLMSLKRAPDTKNWFSKDFRSSKSDQGLDTSKVTVSVSQQKQIMQTNDERKLGRMMHSSDEAAPVSSELTEDLANFVRDNRLVIGVKKGEIQPQTLTIRQRANNPDLAERNIEIQRVQNSTHYSSHPEDFTTNIDTSVLDVLGAPEPTDPVGKLLKRIEDAPVPKELEAVLAYAQPGFYRIMNRVLNKASNKTFMASEQGKQWWASVPKEIKQLISLAVSAVRKMKPYKGGAVYRGQAGGISTSLVNKQLRKPKDEREQFWRDKVGSSKHFSQFVSTSKRVESSYIVKKGSYMAMHIENVKTGVDISAFSNTIEEREVLFPPGTTFRVASVEDKFATQNEPNNRYSEAPFPHDEAGRIKITLEEA